MQLKRIIREEKRNVLIENKLRHMVRQALLEKKKKKKKKGKKGKNDKWSQLAKAQKRQKKGSKKSQMVTRHKPWNWWAVKVQDPNEFGTGHAPSTSASQPLFGGSAPLPEEEWGQWFVAPEEEGLGSPEEQYDTYLKAWDADASKRDAQAAEEAESAAYAASPEGQAEEAEWRSMYG